MAPRQARAGRYLRQCALHVLIVPIMLLATAVTAGAAQTWQVDTTGSHASFSVRVLWIHTIHGTFSHLGGNVDVLEHGQSMQVRAWIDARTVNMDNARYERWLLSPDFFDARRYPRIRFISDVAPLAELTRGGPLRGLVTIHGITRFADFRLQPVNCRQPELAPCVVRLSGSIQRSDFAMSKHHTIISDRVKLDLSIELRSTAEMPAPVQAHEG